VEVARRVPPTMAAARDNAERVLDNFMGNPFLMFGTGYGL
jgi:hypothetical protein